MAGFTFRSRRPAASPGADLWWVQGAFIAVRRRGAGLAALALLAVFGFTGLGFATPAAADTLVSNIDRPVSTVTAMYLRGNKQALGFTTGSHGTGYTLSSIDLRMAYTKYSTDMTVQLATGLALGKRGYTVVATLTNPPIQGSLVNRFTAPSGTVLDANTKYWVVAMAPEQDPSVLVPTDIAIYRASDGGETGKFGWRVDDERLWMGRSGRWSLPLFFAGLPPSVTQYGGPGPFMMRVNGTERASSDPILTISGGSAVTEGTAATFTVTSDKAPSQPLTVSLIVSEPAGSDYVASSEEGSKTVTIAAGATSATYSVATQANSAVEPHGSVTVRVATATDYILGTNSGASVAVHEATPPPLPASDLTASYSGPTAIDLAWALPTQPAGVTVSALEVQRQSAGSWTTVASLGANATSRTVTGLTTGTSYTFRVRVAANHGTADSETVSMTALALPKPATGLTFSNLTAPTAGDPDSLATVDLSWTLPQQGAGVVVSRVEVHSSRSWTAWPDFEGRYGTDELAADATSATMYVAYGRTNHFRVRLFTNSGSVDSEVASWSSTVPLPNATTDLTVSNVTAQTVDLSWTLPEQGEGVVVSAVEVSWAEDGYYCDCRPSWEMVTLAADAVSHTVTGLSPSTPYDFRVRLVANSGRTFEQEDDWTAAAVSGVAVVSDAGDDDTYALGEKIRIQVSFTGGDHSDYPYVNTSGGTPRLKIDMDPAHWGEKWATYESGSHSGTSELTFVHTVVEPNISRQGIAVLANSLELNGGTIRVRSRNPDLSHDGLGHDPAHKVDWRLSPETPAPKAAVELVSIPPHLGDTYALGDTIRIRVKFGEAMNVTGAPRLKIALIGGSKEERWATYEDGSGTDSLTFAYTVAAHDHGVTAVLANTLELNGGTIRSVATSTDADLSHDGLDPDPGHIVYWWHEAAVAQVSSRPANGESYVAGETVRVRLTFDEAVSVTGAPRLKIDMDAPPFGNIWGAYEGGSGTTSLTFTYTVQESDIAKLGFQVLSNSLELNGGTIRWTASQSDVPVAVLDGNAVLLHHGLGHNLARRVNWSPADAWVVATSVKSRPASGDTYDSGETIRVVLRFDEEVDVTGTPRLKIALGDGDSGERWAVYEGIWGSTSAHQEYRAFTYTVAEPDISTQGIAVLANTLELNGGTIKAQATGTNADLAHVGVDHDPEHQVDWQLGAPMAGGAGLWPRQSSGDTYGIGETIRVSVGFAVGHDVLVAGTPRIKIKLDPPNGERWATYESGAGTSFLTFAYTVAEPDISTQGVAVLANSLELNGGLIWSAATGVVAGLSNAAHGPDPLHKVDWTLSPVWSTPATGAPSITGTAQAGETLTVSLGVIYDPDGLSEAARGDKFAYQWVSTAGTTDTDIAGATASTYTLADTDVGRTVKVRVSFTDDRGNAESLTSAPTAAVLARSNPPATGAPTITGTAQVGETLTASTAGIADADGLTEATFAYQWVSTAGSTDTDLAGATASTYTVADADAGRTVKVQVTFTDDAGNTETLTSAPTATVLARPNRPATGAPTIAGTAQVGETLTASTAGIADADGLAEATFAYQWVSTAGSTDTDIAGATASTYTLADTDAGRTVKVRVTFTDDAGNAETLTSAPTAAVPQPPLTASFHGLPAEHDGKKLFSFELRFSKEFDGLRLTALKAGALQVTGGRLVDVKRTVRGENRRVTVRVRPSSTADVTVTLTAPANCSAAAAICTRDTTKLSASVSATVPGPSAAGVLPDLDVADARADEGDTLAFAVTLSRVATGSVTVDYATADGTAAAGQDYTALSGTLTFAAGETEKSVSVATLADRTLDDGETLTLTISNASGATIGNAAATGTLVDVPPLPTIGVADASANEGDTLAFAVTLSEATTVAVTVAYATADGGATAGADYTAASGTLTFAPGDTEKTVAVALLHDALAEGNETLTLSLSNASRATIADGQATGTVTDVAPLTASFEGMPAEHEGQKTFSFVLAFSDNFPGRFSDTTLRDNAFTVTNGAVRGAERVVNGENRRWKISVLPNAHDDVTITLAAGSVSTEAGRPLANTVTATVSGPALLSVADAEAKEGETLTFSVTLDRAATGTVTVDYATADGSAAAGTDYTAASGTLTFAVGETSKTVTVALLYDAAAESDETLTLTLSNPSGAAILDGQATGTVIDVPPITASFEDMPAEHDGRRLFRFVLAFNENFPGRFPYTTLRDSAFTVTNGRVRSAERVVKGENLRWRIGVRPSSKDDVTITLAAGAVSTEAGRPLANTVTATVLGPALLSVADAEADEAEGATVDFAVALNRAASGTVTVDYATADGTATAGEDYTATSGTLTFAAGETSETVSVPLLDDTIDEGSETFTLTLSNPTGAQIADGEATGTIKNTDTMPKAWTSRFGRTVAVHVVDALEARLERTSESWMQLGGHRLGGGPDVTETVQRLAPEGDLWAEAEAADPAGQPLTFRELLMGSAFHLVSNPEEQAGGPRLSAWGRVATSGFEGQEDQVSLNGTVTTGTLGVDAVWERWLTGLLLAYSEGDGSFTHVALPGGDLESSLTSVHPYVAYTLSDRVRLWGMVGYGSGDLQLRLQDRSMDTDLSMTMGALGVRGSLLDPSRAGGLELAVRSDVLWMGMDSAAAQGLAETQADASRLRLVLEGSRPIALAGGGSFTPSLEVGLRHDAGDAETGSGLEVGGSLVYASAWGLSIQASVRGLLAHEDADYEEWGASGALRYDPGRKGKGLTAAIAPAWGSTAGGVSGLWGQPGAAGLPGTDPLAPAAAGRLDAELGYGLAALQGRGLLTPYARVGLTEGADQAWHLGTRLAVAESLNLSLEAGRRAREGDVAAHELALLATLGW